MDETLLALHAAYDAALETYRADPTNAEARQAVREAAETLNSVRGADVEAGGVVVTPDTAGAGASVGEE